MFPKRICSIEICCERWRTKIIVQNGYAKDMNKVKGYFARITLKYYKALFVGKSNVSAHMSKVVKKYLHSGNDAGVETYTTETEVFFENTV